MLSLQLIRQDPEAVRQALRTRGGVALVDEALAVDEKRRRLLLEAEGLKAERRKVSREIGSRLQKEGADRQENAPEMARMRQVGEQIKELETGVAAVEAELHELLLRIPNLPDPSVPVGEDAAGNVQVRTWGEVRRLDFPARPHWEIGESLGIIDFERGVKLSGSRFYVLKGQGARLQRALIAFMLDLHTREHGYTEIYPPYMVKRECMVGSGNLPKFADNLYHDAEDDYWFVPTAEVPLTNLHRDELLEASGLPLHYVAFTACFRREKMAAGKDTRGIKRGHQFDKVELYKFCEPEKSDAELDKMLSNAEEVARRLQIPYRIIQLCTGDMGFAARRSYDIEVWAPGCQEWLEVSSCSNCGDFQARRTNIRYRPRPGERPQFVHTLNGSGLALPRVLIAVLENYQQADGSVAVPEVLQPFMGTDRIGRSENPKS